MSGIFLMVHFLRNQTVKISTYQPNMYELKLHKITALKKWTESPLFFQSDNSKGSCKANVRIKVAAGGILGKTQCTVSFTNPPVIGCSQ